MDFRKIVRRIQRIMAEGQLEAVLLFRPENSAYVSGYLPGGFMTGPVVAVVPLNGDPILVTNFYEEAFVHSISWIENIRVYQSYRRGSRVDAFSEAIKATREVIGELNLSSAPLGSDTLSLQISESFKGNKLTDISRCLTQMQATKSEEEINLVKEAAHIADVGHETFLECSQEDVSEIEVRAKAQLAMYAEAFKLHALGVRDARIGVVGAGLGSGKWPYWFTNTPTSRRIRRGDMIIADGGVVLWSGHNSDMARTAIAGAPTSKQKEMYQAVLDALEAGVRATRPGVKACEIDKAMNDVLAEEGYASYTTRVWGGHDVGFGPRTFDIAPFEERRVESGMVLCLEPGLYIPDIGGIRVEDMVAVRDSGTEILTKCRKDIF
ncbi:MAG: Xaa-Pro peptidase family protein [Candidatus Bathyarchaeia archaeon]